MKKSTILALIDEHLEFEDEAGFIAFANAVEKQARAEFRAKLKPVAYLPSADIDELRKSGRRAAVLYNEAISDLDVPLAIIPKE